MLCPTVFSKKATSYFLDRLSRFFLRSAFPCITSEPDRLPNRYSQQLAVPVTFLHIALLRSVPEYGQTLGRSREALRFWSNDLAQIELWRRECTLHARERERPA